MTPKTLETAIQCSLWSSNIWNANSRCKILQLPKIPQIPIWTESLPHRRWASSLASTYLYIRIFTTPWDHVENTFCLCSSWATCSLLLKSTQSFFIISSSKVNQSLGSIIFQFSLIPPSYLMRDQINKTEENK